MFDFDSSPSRTILIKNIASFLLLEGCQALFGWYSESYINAREVAVKKENGFAKRKINCKKKLA